MESIHMNHEQTPQACPACSVTGDHLRSSVIGRTQERAITHFTCKKCAHTVMVYSAESDMGSVTFGVLTDVAAEEAYDVMQLEAISSDDVLDAYRYFQNASVAAKVSKKTSTPK